MTIQLRGSIKEVSFQAPSLLTFNDVEDGSWGDSSTVGEAISTDDLQPYAYVEKVGVTMDFSTRDWSNTSGLKIGTRVTDVSMKVRAPYGSSALTDALVSTYSMSSGIITAIERPSAKTGLATIKITIQSCKKEDGTPSDIDEDLAS